MPGDSFSIKRMYLEDDRIYDPNSPEKEVFNPSWMDIETGIRRMDGVHRTIVIIGQEDPEVDYMGIGGGAAGIYRCLVYTRDGREFALLDPNQHSNELRNVPMGQTTSVSIRECVPLSLVLTAAKTYTMTGE